MTTALGEGVRVDIHQLHTQTQFTKSILVITSFSFPPPAVNSDDLGSEGLWGFTPQAGYVSKQETPSRVRNGFESRADNSM